MSKPYKGSDGSWYNAGKKMDDLEVSIMNEGNKANAIVDNNKTGLGLSNLSPTPKVNKKTTPIQKKPRPPTKNDGYDKIKDLAKKKDRFSGGISRMLFGRD